MDKDFSLFEANRDRLKRIFLKLSKNEKRLNFVDFQRLCLSGKLIPNFVSQNQVRALAGKFGNAAILTKLFLSYEQFEQFLRIIAVAKPGTGSRGEKVQIFFLTLEQNLRMQFVDVGSMNGYMINRSDSSYSLNSELNESNSSLDLSIKEALNTLKSDTKKTGVASARVLLSPRPAGRAYSNPSTPKSRNYKGFADSSSKIRVSLLSPSQSLKGIARPKNKLELDEFLETEKLVQKEVSNIKVSIRADMKKTEIRGYQRGVDMKNKPVPRFSGAQIETKEKKLEKTILNLTTQLAKHKNFIQRVQLKKTSTRFLLRMLFKTWSLECYRSKPSIPKEEPKTEAVQREPIKNEILNEETKDEVIIN